MTLPCETCHYHRTSKRVVNLGDGAQEMIISECIQEDSKRHNNGHAPTTQFARNDHFGVCTSEGLLHVPKRAEQPEPRAIRVNYAAKRVAARVRAQDELNSQLF